jgi:hypothetical protein
MKFSEALSPGLPLGCTDLGALKAFFAAQGVPGRGWRLYLDYGDDLFEPLEEPFIRPAFPAEAVSQLLNYLKLLASCETDVLPPRPLVESMAAWAIPHRDIGVVPTNFFRSAWKACIAQEYQDPPASLQDFLRESVVPVARWFLATGRHRAVASGGPSPSWGNLERACRDWHAEQRLRQEEHDPAPAEWPTFVTLVECGALRFVCLASEAALALEGAAMSHCIGSYGPRCRGEMLRAYSVRDRKTGDRVATLTVREQSPGRWEIDMIRGFQNASVNQTVQLGAFAVIGALEDAHRLIPAIRADMDRTRAAHEALRRGGNSECVDCDNLAYGMM